MSKPMTIVTMRNIGYNRVYFEISGHLGVTTYSASCYFKLIESETRTLTMIYFL